MGLKKIRNVIFTLAAVSAASTVACGAAAAVTGVEASKHEKKAFQMLKATEVYQSVYDKDTAAEQASLADAEYEYLSACEKFRCGEISQAEFKKAKLDYDYAVKVFEKETKYYLSDEYLKSVMKDFIQEGEPCEQEYAEYENWSKGMTGTMSAAIASGCLLMMSGAVIAGLDNRRYYW